VEREPEHGIDPQRLRGAVSTEIVVIVSEMDPVAREVAHRWGTLPAAEGHVDGVPVRRLGPRALVVMRPGAHIHDEHVDERLPPELLRSRPTLVFPSIHRSERNVPCLTVHPLGNPGAQAEVGGRPRTLVATDPGRMASALRLLAEGAGPLGLSATYEATHHGPEVGLPALFIEIGYGELPRPPPEAVKVLAEVIPQLERSPADRVALGVGGGHYVPHFTELTLRRRWAFGHLISRHAIAEMDRATALAAYERTAGAEGIVFARAEDARHPMLEGIGARLREQDAPMRGPRPDGGPTGAARSASGT